MIAGLPGSGKSTIAIPVARRLAASYVRIDTIEQAMVSSGEVRAQVGAVGYEIGYAVAADQLRVGATVIAECVNPLALTRDAWRAVAASVGSWFVDVEVTCSDRSRHRERVETRSADIPGLVLPTWQQVLDRRYEPWDRDRLVVDTAQMNVAEAVDSVARYVSSVAHAHT